jgi:putative transposase
MDQICQHFGITRQAHYQKWRREVRCGQAGVLILEMVRQIRRKHPRMGTRKLLLKLDRMMSAEGLTIGRDRLFELLRGANLLVKPRKRGRRTTIPGLRRVANHLPGLTISYPNQVWVGDITYLETETQPFVYLFVLMDLFSRYIVGWQVCDSLATSGALEALQASLRHSPSPSKGLIHHSDHGVQYASYAYLDTLLQHEIQPSMGAVGNCYDNAFAERVIGTLKGEYGLDTRLLDLGQAQGMAQEAVHLYNTDRPHLAIDYAYPSQVYFGIHPHVPPVVIPKPEEVSS